jgi:hypothetical protein
MSDTAEIRQLRAEGFTFHGSYSFRKEEIKQRAAELRKQGHKARMVYIPSDKLSRGHSGGGYSIYWIESEASKIARAEEARLSAIRNIERELATLEERKQKLEAQLAGLTS